MQRKNKWNAPGPNNNDSQIKNIVRQPLEFKLTLERTLILANGTESTINNARWHAEEESAYKSDSSNFVPEAEFCWGNQCRELVQETLSPSAKSRRGALFFLTVTLKSTWHMWQDVLYKMANGNNWGKLGALHKWAFSRVCDISFLCIHIYKF